MIDFLKRHRYPISLLVVLLGLIVILFQSRHFEAANRVQMVVQTITYPVQTAVHTLLKTISNWIDNYLFLTDLKQENRRLNQEIEHLKEQLNQHMEESVQYRRLRGQLLFAQRQPYKKIFAEIIGESADNVHQVRLINRGSLHGIKRNLSAILKEGLVGRIQAVTPFQSSLQLVIDQRSRVPALMQRNRVRGLVYGTQSGLALRQINRRAVIKLGDRVISSGLGGMFPKGILIGTVTKLHLKPYELFQTAELEPAVDFSRMEEVFIILSGPYKPGTPLFTQ